MEFVALQVNEEKDLASNLAVISRIARELESRKYVKSTYADSVAQREESYPTGLEVGNGISVAIPHTEACHVLRSAMAFAPLAHPVDFHLMVDPDHVTPVNLVVMLAVDDPHKQVPTLRSLMGLFQDEQLVKGILGSSIPAEIRELVSASFQE